MNKDTPSTEQRVCDCGYEKSLLTDQPFQAHSTWCATWRAIGEAMAAQEPVGYFFTNHPDVDE